VNDCGTSFLLKFEPVLQMVNLQKKTALSELHQQYLMSLSFQTLQMFKKPPSEA
jgi:hypothetical protein